MLRENAKIFTLRETNQLIKQNHPFDTNQNFSIMKPIENIPYRKSFVLTNLRR